MTSPSWYWLTSGSGFDYAASHSAQWGNQALGDVPRVADMDGDGKGDFVIWRAGTGTWYSLCSATSFDYRYARSGRLGTQAFGDVPLMK